MQLKENKFVAESGHYYRRDGSTAYEIVGKNGKTRNTTVRDAKVHNLVPSVTTILRMAAAPGLENWKAEQLLLAALTLPRDLTMTEADWLNAVRQDARETARKAADMGTSVHAALESAFEGRPFSGDYVQHVDAVRNALRDRYGPSQWVAEESFAHPSGFGGKVDLHRKDNPVVLDFKTKAVLPDDLKAFDEHHMQLSAYRQGLGIPGAACANVFVSVTLPVKVVIIEHTSEELDRGWNMFTSLLAFWKAAKSYDPSWQ